MLTFLIAIRGKNGYNFIFSKKASGKVLNLIPSKNGEYSTCIMATLHFCAIFILILFLSIYSKACLEQPLQKRQNQGIIYLW